MAIISGTSSSHIVVSNHHEFITGICGPYDDAILSGFSCYESGQNLTGKVLETLLAHHPLYPAFVEKLALSNDSMFDQLNASVFAYAAEQNHTFPALLAKNFHIYPELHGNRSPTSDPMLRGMISGLQVPVRTPSRLPSPTMTLFYYSTLLGICYGTRHIIDTHKTSGIVIADIVLSGALCSNSLFAQSLADVAQCRVIVGSCGGEQTPLLGGAISAAAAYHTTNVSQKLWDCMKNMTAPDHIYEPAGPDVLAFHDRKYRVYLKMLHDQLEYRSMMHE